MVSKTKIKEKKARDLKQKSRHISIKEGIFASAKNSLGTQYLSPFAISVNARYDLVAMMSAVAGMLGPLFQILGSRLMEKHSRKKIVTKYTLLESFSWLTFIIIGFLFAKGILITELPIIFLFFFSISIIFLNIITPSWFSWTGDIVDENYRGRWISKRNLMIGVTSLVLAIAAAFFLEYMKKDDNLMFGFGILFFLAFVARIICWKLFKKQYEPKLKIKHDAHFSFFEFLVNARKSNFGRLSIFRLFFSFSIMIANSLIAVYLLRELNMTYTSFMIVILSATFFALLISEIWGKIADKYGNYRVLAISTILIPIIPILWVLNHSLIYLILVPGLIRGVGWAGLNLAEGNFIYDNVSPEKRGIAISYYNMMMGIGFFLGGLTGAFLIKFLNTSQISPITIIFLISSLLSMAVVAFLMPKIKEIKKKKRGKNPKEFKTFLLKQIIPTLTEEMHQIANIKKYIWQKE